MCAVPLEGILSLQPFNQKTAAPLHAKIRRIKQWGYLKLSQIKSYTAFKTLKQGGLRGCMAIFLLPNSTEKAFILYSFNFIFSTKTYRNNLLLCPFRVIYSVTKIERMVTIYGT